MVKKLLLAGVALVAVAMVAVYGMSQSVFASEAAREALTAQLSKALGQPVTAGGLRASALARVGLTLTDVTIGDRSPIHVDAIEIRASLLSLLTRRLDGARITVHRARVPLPAPALTVAAAVADGSAPVTLASVGELTLDDLELTTRGRRLRVNAVLVPHGERAITVREASLAADDMRATITGEITDRAAPEGTLTARANRIDGDLVLALVSEFSERPASADPADAVDIEPGGAPAPAAGPGIAVEIEADGVSMGALTLTGLKGRAVVRHGETTFEPVSFGLFSGTYAGQVTIRYAASPPSVRWYGDVENIRLPDVMSLGERAGALTGLLEGDVDLTGSGTNFTRALQSARGSARVAISDGTIGKLAIVRSILAATSANPQQAAENPSGPDDTVFKALSTALTISGGSGSLIDLQLESDDFTMTAGGGLKLDGSAVTVFADLQLSEALSTQVAAGRGRRLAPGARLTVPATIRGNTARYSVQVDLAEMTAAPTAAR